MVKIMDRLESCCANSMSPRATAARDLAAKTMAKTPKGTQHNTVLRMAQTNMSVGFPALTGGGTWPPPGADCCRKAAATSGTYAAGTQPDKPSFQTNVCGVMP